MKPKKDSERLLTEAELGLMTILWRLGEGSVADVMAKLPADRELAYTSVSTILRILEQKGALKSRKEGRGHLYRPTQSKEAYEATTLRHVVTKVFDGAPSSLVQRLIEDDGLTDAELQSIRALLNAKLKQPGRSR